MFLFLYATERGHQMFANMQKTLLVLVKIFLAKNFNSES